MNLSEVKKQRMTARKDGDRVKYGILTLLVGEIETSSKSSNAKEVTVESVARKLIKSNNESLAVKNDPQLAAENEILMGFLPSQLSESQLVEVIENFVQAESKSIGEVMKHLNQNYADQFDRGLAAKIAKQHT